MVQKAFLTEKVKEIVELTEGFFNVAFRIGLEDKNVILKIAPPVDTEIMTYEKNIMYSEVDVMKIIAEKAPVPVPKILFYDNSHEFVKVIISLWICYKVAVFQVLWTICHKKKR